MSGIHDEHRERLDRKVREHGLEMLEPHEQLEHLLYAVIPRGDTNEIAHRLLERFITISGVLNADVEELVKIKGVGRRTAMFLTTMPSMLGIVERSVKYEEPPRLFELDEIFDYASTYLRGRLMEAAYLFSLNSAFKLLAVSKVSEGTQNEMYIQPKKVVKQAIMDNAMLALIVHNHPCGNPNPSFEDIALSRTLNDALEAVDIRLVDSVIISGNEIYSIKEKGYLRKLKDKNSFDTEYEITGI